MEKCKHHGYGLADEKTPPDAVNADGISKDIGQRQEDEYGNTPAQRAELDWLLWNKPLEYVQMVLRGEMEHYLSLGCEHGRSEN